MDQNTTQMTEQGVIREARKSYSRSLLNISIFYAVFYIIITIIIRLMPEKPTGQTQLLVNYIPFYCIAFPFYLLISKFLPKSVPEKKSLPVIQFILTFFCCECISIARSLIGAMFNVVLSLLLGKNTSSMFLLEGVFGNDSILFLMIAIVFAPFVEEMVFRKVLIDRIRKYGDGLAIVISGLMFGLFHGNLTQFFYATGIGMLLAFMYVRTGKAQYNILMHMMMNFWGTFLPRILLRNVDMQAYVSALKKQDIATLMELLPSLSPVMILGCVNFTMAAVGLVVMILKRKDFHVNPPEVTLPKKKRLSAAFLNIGFCSLFAVCIIRFIQQLAEALK